MDHPLDQIGPLAKDVTDCATLLEAIASHDEKDSTSVRLESYDFTSALKRRCQRNEDRYSKGLLWKVLMKKSKKLF